MTALRIVAPGASCLVEDLGRPGLARLGVGRSGAADRGALALANRLVGNAEGAAGLEVLLGGFRAVAEADAWIAVTGARGPILVDGVEAPPAVAVRMPAGAELELRPAEHGLRYLVGVRGGIAAPEVLGSRSRDTLAGLGPAPVAAGDRLPIGPEPEAQVALLDREAAFAPVDGPVVLELVPGPRADWFTDAARALLFDAEWRTSAAADRVGTRLEGPALERLVAGELASEATVPGSIQVSTSGQPTILGPDRPVTGGYPVIAIVAPASLDRVAQLRPGQPVRFRHAR
ncbi:biotin-dependent carboxyltransferase family protein [Agromyces sp. NBRC 114283]|uniref:5-oxoprolinase subunit C family protein n=1 Tax=Agromyces sp. NBRC 114283 TaxID=2994521 RepID=UPI0024A07B51|nr:biotin-dependent carboxyltransferase family protein [Agromyces sp. NBRC 114283]GLU89070.1 allophanate hydrolase [Agromyces sp. NBRC 114283]